MGTIINKKSRILLLIKLPPPLTGATLMNYYVANSDLLSSNFNFKIQSLQYANNIQNIGKFSFLKIFKIFKNALNLLKHIVFFQPNIVYFQISPLSKGFIRDVIFVSLIKLFNKKLIYHLHGKGIKIKSEEFS